MSLDHLDQEWEPKDKCVTIKSWDKTICRSLAVGQAEEIIERAIFHSVGYW